jgi:two-component system sensor histidine kinase RpfC
MFAKLKARQDTEHEQCLIRVGLSIFALVFLSVAYQASGKIEGKFIVMVGAAFYFLFSLGLLVFVYWDKRPSPVRRLLGIAVDIAMVTYALYFASSVAAALYGGYLWAIIANGFRFGKKYLYAAQLMAVIGFTYVINAADYWAKNPSLSAGLLIWLVVIPPYVSILLGRLEEAVSDARQANQAKSQFLANMSHELRTPLTAIIGYSDMLAEEAAEDKKDHLVRDLRNIQHSGSHLLGLINEVLDLSKIEANRMEVCEEEVDINALINDVVSTIEPIATKNNNRLSVNVPPGFGFVRTDLTKLRQVLFNLLSNACKFTNKGVVTLDVTRNTVENKEWIVFKVVDTGIGIAPEKIDKLFMPFSQEDQSISKKFGGTGLGLVISKRFCELLGGRINLVSQKGKGSTFTVTLPTHFTAT